LNTTERFEEIAMGARRIRREQRQFDQHLSRRVNGMRKTEERVRRQTRMVEILKKGKWPYTPAVRSWLSTVLDKPSSRITPEEVTALLGQLK
jgi:hypothetical protein